MSIRTKILLGCLSLTMVTLLFGLLARSTQAQLGNIAFRLYDEAFMSMSYLRSAQNTLLTISRDTADTTARPAVIQDRLASAIEDLGIARTRALSSQGEQATAGLHEQISQVSADLHESGRLPDRELLVDIERRLDTAVEIYAGDGFRSRRTAGALVESTALQTWAAMGISLAVALGITVVLGRAIVPSVRHAVGIATAIAAGRLDNPIEVRGRSETSTLLRALSVMQRSIAANIARIEELMATQASNHATEIASQHARFETALDNMVQGLCMFDDAGQVLVHNRRFGEMFGPFGQGTPARDALPPALFSELERHSTASLSSAFTKTLDDQRTIAVSEKPMVGGGWVATYEDVTERHRVEARMAFMARHDALTGLPNRVLYREQMEHALSQIHRGGSLAVLCLDLDNFKAVNDTLGHPIGDALLHAVAQRLLAETRETDTVVRLGGDEFAIIQSSSTQPGDSKTLAERLVAVLGEPFTIADHTIAIGTSIGIAITTDGLTNADALLKSADLALYRAKADGRATYRFFEAEMDARIQARRLLEIDLRRAVAENQFEIFYQPLVTSSTREVSGFEALVRWRHPIRGMISPAEFIPLAEETGLIARIGAIVLARACQDATEWPTNIKVAVNLSPLQFRNRQLAAEVAVALERSGLQAARLELEITESLLLQDSEATLAILHEIRALGVCISMDDFGTGYSSLSYLRRFPFDKIKIDQSFVRNLGESGDCLAIVRAVLGLGKSLGMSVIAEGVETDEQLALLQQEGCEQVQGYLFSQPKPIGALRHMLQGVSLAA
ncbi:MAG: EAL domain-containing protein [Acetobacteraceae bacterium]